MAVAKGMTGMEYTDNNRGRETDREGNKAPRKYGRVGGGAERGWLHFEFL